jgi:hypothetical protein
MNPKELEKLINDMRKAKLKSMEEVENFLVTRLLSLDSAIFLNECTDVHK